MRAHRHSTVLPDGRIPLVQREIGWLSYNVPCRKDPSNVSIQAVVAMVIAAVCLAATIIVLIITMNVGVENADACKIACGEGNVRSVTSFKCYCKD